MRKVVFFAALLFSVGVTSIYAAPKPKYIFYFIGDGMGITHTYITNAYLKAVGEQQLSFTSFPVLGLADTECHGRQITDSAAAGTALATGVRTTPEMIGMSHDTLAVENISSKLHQKGMKVGIISTASIDHATPAAFYAHQPSREMYFEISEELPLSGFNFFGGGGVLDNPNFATTTAKHGYRIAATRTAFDSLKNGDDKVIAISPTLQAESAMTYAIDRAEGELTLADFVRKGIEVLDNENGFFIMTEGGKIDWLAHANDVGATIREVQDFDNAIRAALDFYHKHPEETLILVTADHETGGFGAGSTLKGYDSDYTVYQGQTMSYLTFSNEVAKYRNGKSPRKDINVMLSLLKRGFGINELNPTELKAVQEGFVLSMIPYELRNRDREYKAKYGSYDPMTVVAMNILATRAGIGTTTYYHTATPVLIQAIGVGSDAFVGRMENREIPGKIVELVQH